MFSTVIRQRGAYISGGVGEAYNLMYFFRFQVDGPITRRAYKQVVVGGGGGGGVITGILWEVPLFL